MKNQDARKEVINAGIRLVKSGLTARTWGNISCRVDEDTMVITPSGRDYMGLKPEDLVEVKISDGSYTDKNKPSVEKNLHGEVYKLHPEAGFVIHTHQVNACLLYTSCKRKTLQWQISTGILRIMVNIQHTRILMWSFMMMVPRVLKPS